MRAMIFGALLLGAGACKAESHCFSTPLQAALQVGEQEGGGYRLELVRRDALSGRSWARVRSCAHPEWPAMVVPAEGALIRDQAAYADHGRAVAQYVPASELVVKVGHPVTVIDLQALTRIEMPGIAQSSGRVGERVWVRIVAPPGGEDRTVQGIVRGARMVETGQ